MEQEILDYISQAQKHGLTDFEIKQNLVNAGWEAQVVEENFVHAKAAGNQTPVASSSQVLPESKTPNSNFAPVVQQAQFQTVKTTESYLQGQPVLSDSAVVSGQAEKKSFFKKPAFWITLVVLFVLCGSAYGYYNFIFANPTKIWSKFTTSTKNSIYNTKFNFSYTDSGQLTAEEAGPLGMSLRDISVSFSGDSYINVTDQKKPQSNSKIQYSFGSSGTSFTTGVQYTLLDNVLYLNVGSNPFLDMISSSMNNGKKIDWVKIDLTELQKQASSSPDSAKIYDKLFGTDFKSQMQKIWDDTTIIKVGKYIGREKINGVETLHFQNTVDKDALKGLVNKYAQLLSDRFKGSSMEFTDSDTAFFNQLAAALIDKVQIQDFQTWIGLFDAKLYRVHVVTNAPSFISLVKNADKMNFSLNSGNDAKRVADMRQMSTAMELYFNDNNGYPDGLNGKPLDITPMYIGQLPTAPPAEGRCTDYYNNYWYTPKGTKTVANGKTVYSSYQLTFCLGVTTGGLKEGVGMITPSGFQDGIACPTTLDKCVGPLKNSSQDEEVKKKINDFIGTLDFSAKVSADADYANYGKTTQLTAPTDAFDIMQQFKQATSKSTDAKRLADIRQLASAMELYYNDYDSYPKTLSLLAPKYIGQIPTAPTPPDGTCTTEQNNYTYKFISANSYKLDFCLGQKTGGYSGGAHELTQSGIN